MDDQKRKQAITECRILESLKHPNIVRFREVYRDKKMKMNIVMDFCNGGNLDEFIRKLRKENNSTGNFKFMTEWQVLNWFAQICLAVKLSHDRKILHRDIKSQNIFLMSNGLVKLGDFGCSTIL